MPQRDLVCFAHLRWDFTFQRPNHLMARAAQDRRVFYIEEPVYDELPPEVAVTAPLPSVWVCTPRVPPNTSEDELRDLVQRFLCDRGIERPVVWVYSPMLFPLVRGLDHAVLVHDCMDELSLFLNAPAQLRQREDELFRVADLVFTGGRSLYEAKREKHARTYLFPSSVDTAHFNRAEDCVEPQDQRSLPRPRIGFFGVIDERLDLELLKRISVERDGYQFILVGPVVKISESTLPRAPNLHYLGPKDYADLPAYLAGWNVAIMPFALNDATRFISPTKTLEYLAAGKPVVSTAVRDVERPYGQMGAVRIASADDFSRALDAALADRGDHHAQTDEILRNTSWDSTWDSMSRLISTVEARGSNHV